MPVVGRRAAVVVELTAGYGPAMIAPLGSRARPGLLVALRSPRAASRSPPDELDLLAAFAAQASVVLELARAQQRERRLQVQADRDRIARDLHDHVVQRIFATALSLDRLSRSLETEHPEAAERLVPQRRRAGRHDGRIRASIFELHQEEDPSPPPCAASSPRSSARSPRATTSSRDLRFRGAVDDLPRSSSSTSWRWCGSS